MVVLELLKRLIPLPQSRVDRSKAHEVELETGVELVHLLLEILQGSGQLIMLIRQSKGVLIELILLAVSLTCRKLQTMVGNH